jgi:mRNA-degrading endonuclease toxin of MazEF toxin-antitoxin module
MHPERGDVVRSTDPLKLGEDRQRPWLIVNNDSHPFDDEQFVAVAVSTKEYDDSLALDSEVWVTGDVPRESFVSPWAVHSPRIEDLVAWQGRVRTEFADRVVDALVEYVK